MDKRLLSIICVLMFAMIGCGKVIDNSTTTTTTSSTTTSTTTSSTSTSTSTTTTTTTTTTNYYPHVDGYNWVASVESNGTTYLSISTFEGTRTIGTIEAQRLKNWRSDNGGTGEGYYVINDAKTIKSLVKF